MRHIERADFKSLFEDGNKPVGTILQIPSEELVEILGYAGLDYIVLDMEHCPSSHMKIVSLIRAAESVGLVPLVRVPCTEDEESIKKALDGGATGLLLPQHFHTRAGKACCKVREVPPCWQQRRLPVHKSELVRRRRYQHFLRAVK